MQSIDDNLKVLHGFDLQVQKMASEAEVQEFMVEQDKQQATQFDLRRLEQRSTQINEAFDILKTPTAAGAPQQPNFFRNKKILLSGSSDFLKSREFKSSKSRNAELNRPSGNPLEDLDEDASNISMMSVTTNLNEQPVNINFTEQLE